MMTFVIAIDGTRLMPTSNIKKVRKLLKTGQARIAGHDPFTIQLMYESGKHVQAIEICQDTGDKHIGLCVKSEKHVYASEQYDLLQYEPERHNDQKKLRRSRRNRLRYRAPRFNNRTRGDKWLAPTLEHKIAAHMSVIKKYVFVCPVTSIVMECAAFDTQALNAKNAGADKPEGTDYQRGPRFGYDNLREAVFTRDKYTCQVCGKGIDEKKILRIHHIGYWKCDRTNRLSNLLTVCLQCHTGKNHKEGGKLYGREPVIKTLSSAAFMNSVRNKIIERARENFQDIDVRIAYGAATKRERLSRRISKSHANDAYCMGMFRPKHKAKNVFWKKRRRNNRILEKFYDARMVDTRTGKIVSGAELSTNRTDRKVPRNNAQNLRKYRGKKVRKGKRVIRTQRYPISPGDRVLVNGHWVATSGMHNKGTRLIVNGKSISVNAVQGVVHAGGWQLVS